MLIRGSCHTLGNIADQYVSKVLTDNFRLQGTKFSLLCGSFLILNTVILGLIILMKQLLTLLGEIRRILIKEKCIYNLVLGDLTAIFLAKAPLLSSLLVSLQTLISKYSSRTETFTTFRKLILPLAKFRIHFICHALFILRILP